MMGYYNPIYIYGVDKFLDDALDAGIDGLIVVDLPPEMDDELCIPALEGHQFHPAGDADDRRQAPAQGAEEHVGLRLLCVDDRHHRFGAARYRARSPARSSASRAIRTCRSASASASRPPNRRGVIGASGRRRRRRHRDRQRRRQRARTEGQRTADPAEAVATLVAACRKACMRRALLPPNKFPIISDQLIRTGAGSA